MKRKPSGADHFEVGEAHCLLTLKPVAVCDHCALLPKSLAGSKIRTTKVDYHRGVITMEMDTLDAMAELKP